MSKRDGVVDISLFEHIQREDLNARCPRRMAVLRPLRVVIENYPEGEVGVASRPRTTPSTPSAGGARCRSRASVYIERDDFREDAPKKWFRLAPGHGGAPALRLPDHVQGGDQGRSAARSSSCAATWDPASRGGNAPDGRNVKGTLHWVSADARARRRGPALRSSVRERGPDAGARRAGLHAPTSTRDSLEVLRGCKLEPSLADCRIW